MANNISGDRAARFMWRDRDVLEEASEELIINDTETRSFNDNAPLRRVIIKRVHSRSRCMACERQPVIAVHWANGHGMAWFCLDDFTKWVQEDDRDIVGVWVLKDGVCPKDIRKTPAGTVKIRKLGEQISGKEIFKRIGALLERGGPGSGFEGHAGRPGEVGGSVPSDKAPSDETSVDESLSTAIKETYANVLETTENHLPGISQFVGGLKVDPSVLGMEFNEFDHTLRIGTMFAEMNQDQLDRVWSDVTFDQVVTHELGHAIWRRIAQVVADDEEKWERLVETVNRLRNELGSPTEYGTTSRYEWFPERLAFELTGNADQILLSEIKANWWPGSVVERGGSSDEPEVSDSEPEQEPPAAESEEKAAHADETPKKKKKKRKKKRKKKKGKSK